MGLLDKEIKEYDEFIENEFKKTWKVVKAIFKENNWTRPRDWKQIIDWHYHKYKSMEGYKYPDIKDKKNLVEWAKDTQGLGEKENKINSERQLITIKNNFNQMPIEEVRSHFKPLIEINNPKGVIWMTNEDFDIFIRRSFGKDESLEKPKINLGHGAKMALVKLFYQFYDKCQNEYLTQDRKKDFFLDLLKNAFNTDIFNNLDNSNFKSKKSMKFEWKR